MSRTQAAFPITRRLVTCRLRQHLLHIHTDADVWEVGLITA